MQRAFPEIKCPIFRKQIENERIAASIRFGAGHAIEKTTMNPIIISKTNCQTSNKPMLRRLMLATGASILLIAGASTSCSTARGFGRDVEKTGDKIQEAAVRAD